MTILFKNVLLINGLGHAAVKTDVLVRDEKIAAIGYFPKYKADTIIDGLGTAYLTPGFIDVNTYSDLYFSIFSNPLQPDFLAQGVTTILGGQSGISLAPLISRSFSTARFWADIRKFNTNWHTFKDFLIALQKYKIGVNFGSLVGFSTLRQAIIGNDFRDLNLKEINALENLTDSSLKEGAFGVSFDLNFPLTAFVPSKEIKPLLDLVEKNKSIATFKMRYAADSALSLKGIKENFVNAAMELINFSKESGARIQINNFSCPKGQGKIYENVLEILRENSNLADISFNVNPFDISFMPAYAFLPEWARRGSLDSIRDQIKDKEILKKIKKEIPIFKSEDVRIFQAPGFEYLIGKSIKDFGEVRGFTQRESLLELMRITNMRLVFSIKNLGVKTLDKALNRERSTVSSSFGDFSENTFKGNEFEHKKTFPTYLEYIWRKKVIPFEKGVAKITGIPAKQFGIKNRGVVLENFYADLVLLRDLKVDTVLVNGKITVFEGKINKIFNGKILKRNNV